MMYDSAQERVMQVRVFFTLLFFVLFVSAPFFAQAATLNLVTDKTQLKVGEELHVDIKIDSEEVGINGAQVTLEFPKGVLVASSTGKTTSVFNFWLQDPLINNEEGKISFIGGNANGVSGKSLEIVHVTFRVVGVGVAHLAFTDGAITANDGNGTNVLSLMNGITITSVGGAATTILTPKPDALPPPTLIKRTPAPAVRLPSSPVVNISLYPHVALWYNTISPFLVTWRLPNDVTSVATEVNKQAVFDPTRAEGLFDNKTFPALSDGVWYVHVRFKNLMGWGSTTNYKIGIDTIPPLSYAVTVKEDIDIHAQSPTISYETHDQPSGIAFYRILVDGNEATSTASETFTLPPQHPGEHLVIIEATDFAGNKTFARTTVLIREHPFLVIGWFSLTQFGFFTTLLLIMAAGIIVAWLLYRGWRLRVARKVMIAQRDVMNSIAGAESDIVKLMKNNSADPTPEREATTEFILKNMHANMEKAKKYVVENIKEIDE